MIFASKNEKGEVAWRLVLQSRKTVTRRLKPQPIGAIRSVQPNRGKKAVGKIQIIDCKYERFVGSSVRSHNKDFEALKEGFYSWSGVKDWFIGKYATYLLPVYRIEFKVIE